MPRAVRRRPAAALAFAATLLGCTSYEPIDTAAVLADGLRRDLGREVAVPFALGPRLSAAVADGLRAAPRETYRVEQLLDFIFRRVGLRYALMPTRSAEEAFAAREGNCLSFVNLFVGVGRELRLNPFYVEVTDYQRWNYRQGMVVSQGHIVAGMYVSGELKTYDFLPYQAKAYKTFAPIDDRAATAHYYNNLGAERLLANDLDEGIRLVELAVRIRPGFAKAVNNLGAAYTRAGRTEEAIDLLRGGLEEDPQDVPMLTNLVRAYQALGRHEEALATLDRIEATHTTNPYFYVYKADAALAAGAPATALEYLREALRQDTEVAEVHVALAKTYLALGDVEKARHHLARALRLDATNDRARELARAIGG